MNDVIFPMSKQIYVKIDDTKIPFVQSYEINESREIKRVCEIGNETPSYLALSKPLYEIVIKRVKMYDYNGYQDIDFSKLKDFDVFIFKPKDRRFFYRCNIKNIKESLLLGGNVEETITIMGF